MVKKARADSHSISLGEPTDDATYARDDLPSYEEPPFSTASHLPKKLEPLFSTLKLNEKTSPRRLRKSPTIDLNGSPRHEPKFVKQKSEDHILINKKFALSTTNSSCDDTFDKHPRLFDTKSELKVSGGGSMFLKSNTKKNNDTPDVNLALDSQKPTEKKSILREHLAVNIKDFDLDLSTKSDNLYINEPTDKNEKDDKTEDDEKKSVRFDLQSKNKFNYSDESLSDEELSSKKNINPVLQVSLSSLGKSKSPFALAIENEVLTKPPLPTNKKLKAIKQNCGGFAKPSLIRTKSSESEDDSPRSGKIKNITIEEIDLDSDNSTDSPDERISKRSTELERIMDRKVEKVKEKLWKSKNEELVKFQENLEDSQREELRRIIDREHEVQENKVMEALAKIRTEIDNRNMKILADEEVSLNEKLETLKSEQTNNFRKEEERLKQQFELKKEELEKYYEEKLAEIETNLADNVEKNRDELLMSHKSTIDQLKENHNIIIDQLKKELRLEEQQIRADHQNRMQEMRIVNVKELESGKSSPRCDYEKLKYEKKLLEDKYKCLKDKYIRLKNDVRSTIEKRNKKKEEGKSCATTTTTGSETERSFSTHKERTPMHSPSRRNTDKPPTPKPAKNKDEHYDKKENASNDLDTSFSDKSEEKLNKNDCDTSDNSISHSRNRKKLFSRMKSNSATRSKGRGNLAVERSCSPVENLRRQLQKLEDLEDQFPQNQPPDTYHLRYPFSDGQKFEGSSELEFFRHRIHLERDSIKRAKESLRSQKTLFRQRQKELKLKHGSMARHTYQQLCQEEKDLTDMEVSLHRTRSLLGEKVIRLRHLEQTLQRATVTNDQSNYDDATLSDLSSHSASSGISSTEFATNDPHFPKGAFKGDSFQEPSEIIQNLESLNSEIREIWEVLRKQQRQSGNIAAVMPPFMYPDLGWPVLAETSSTVPTPASIPTLADRLFNYRQHIALANAQSTVVTHAANQGVTTTLVERTRNLRHWLKQAGVENIGECHNPHVNL
ncbi:hypothetical protein WA026_020784 [Henosepilachna vigintioctopunctata]